MFKPTIPKEYYKDMSNLPTPTERRGRFTRFLEKRKEERTEPRPTVSATTTNTDSAYASSENDPTRKATPDADFVQVENHEIPGVAQDRSLWLDKNNGEIYDEDTGDVVTTVTTTTTTTTTTTSRGGRKQEVVDVKTTQGEPHPHGVDARGSTTGTLGVAPRDAAGITEMPAGTSQPVTSHTTSTAATGLAGTGLAGSSAAAPMATHNSSIHPGSHTVGGSVPTRNDSSPPIPSRNPGRVSGEFSHHDTADYDQIHPSGSTAQGRPNFSYPSRASPAAGTTEEVPVRTSGGTFSNLKAAAIAAHGIGETLRGTLNEAVDSRYPRSNSKKAAAVDTKNQAVLNRGRNEMEGFNAGPRRTDTLDSTTGVSGNTYNNPSGTQHMGTHDSTAGVPHNSTYDNNTGIGQMGNRSNVTGMSHSNNYDNNTTGIGQMGNRNTTTGLPHSNTYDNTADNHRMGTNNSMAGVPHGNTFGNTNDNHRLGNNSNTTGVSHGNTLGNTTGGYGGNSYDNQTGVNSGDTFDHTTGTHHGRPFDNTTSSNTSGISSTGTNPNYHPPTGTMVGNNSATTNAINTDSVSNQPESRSSGFGKLFKRKPIGENQPQSTKYF